MQTTGFVWGNGHKKVGQFYFATLLWSVLCDVLNDHLLASSQRHRGGCSDVLRGVERRDGVSVWLRRGVLAMQWRISSKAAVGDFKMNVNSAHCEARGRVLICNASIRSSCVF